MGVTRARIEQGLLDARVTHTRRQVRPYALSHRLTYLHLPLEALGCLPWPWLGYNRWALSSVRDRDYGSGAEPLALRIERALAETGAALPAGGRISLLTLPRVAGLAFNPVSFWLCRDAEGGLRAVLAEVNSTFGERHSYLCRKPDGSPIGPSDRMLARKVMYVSPFLPVDGEYTFRFADEADRLGVFISYARGGKPALYASIVGHLRPLTVRSWLARLVRRPLPAVSVLLLIHYHAARLYLRGLRLLPGPRALSYPLSSTYQAPSPTPE